MRGVWLRDAEGDAWPLCRDIRALTVRSATTHSPVALVVDDDAAIRETLYQLLQDEGYQVEQAPDGVIALETLRATTQRMIVLLDVMMPRLDGFGVLQAVTSDETLSRQHRYIVMTAAAGVLNERMMQLMRHVSAPALIKPFSLDELLATMSDALSQLDD
jgi:CheY-like chemotaxis protein